MHEIGMIRDMVNEIEKQAVDRGAKRVSRVVIEVGKISGVSPQAIEEAFNLLVTGTMLEGAVLLVKEVPAKVRCRKCGDVKVFDSTVTTCPQCGSSRARIDHIHTVKVVYVLVCPDCGLMEESFLLNCHRCHSSDVSIESGMDIVLKEFEIER